MTLTYPFPVSGDEFKGKRVLVTGGTKGMGQAMVRRFTLSGASVATTARSPLPEGQAVALFVQTDIGTAAGVQEVISGIQQEWAGLDILVNNVGGSDAPNGGYKALSDDDWQKALNVNLLASVRLDRAFLPGMIAMIARDLAAPLGLIPINAEGLTNPPNPVCRQPGSWDFGSWVQEQLNESRSDFCRGFPNTRMVEDRDHFKDIVPYQSFARTSPEQPAQC